MPSKLGRANNCSILSDAPGSPFAYISAIATSQSVPGTNQQYLVAKYLLLPLFGHDILKHAKILNSLSRIPLSALYYHSVMICDLYDVMSTCFGMYLRTNSSLQAKYFTLVLCPPQTVS
jgi:hypothetical protein